MKINSIKIENLFDIFHYDIAFKPNENVLIITGPNGYGKTMILNIIFNLFSRKFLFFQKLVFEKITICLDENITILIGKTNNDAQKSIFGEDENKFKISFRFYQNEIELENLNYSQKSENNIERFIESYLPIHRVASNKWIDPSTDKILNTDDVLTEYVDQLPDEITKNILRVKSDKVNKILDSIKVHLIKEQRLFKKADIKNSGYSIRELREEKERTVMVDAIQTYSDELKQLIRDVSQKSFIQTQELDSSYPKRLTNENNILNQGEYEKKFNALKDKQQKLTQFGLYESKQEFLNYSTADAKALSVYLKDFEQKLSVFDELLEKLELFSNILNERRFTFKSIKINRSKGFYFETSKGKELELNQLSSGEQHEVVLLYELIFNVKPNVLVLIDEPEISLHVSWQKEFLSDLLKIVKIQKIQVLVATHSPSIINDRWDLVYNLVAAKTK
jgi:predicted ATP-binding protein involved in virulence